MPNFWIACGIFKIVCTRFGLVAFSVLKCRDLLVYVYCLLGLTDVFATMSPGGRRLRLDSQLR